MPTKTNENMTTAQAALAAKRMTAQHSTAILPAAPIAESSGMTALQIVEHTPNIEKLGETFAASGFFGSATKNMATAALVNCFIEGLSPVEYRAKYHLMENGNTTVKSDYIQREFHRLGGEWRFNEWTAEVCDITFSYRGQTLNGRVTLDEFKANGVAMSGTKLKTNWAKFPREMLKARCMATYIRALCPEALGGLYTQEEAMDFPPPKAVPPSAVKVSPSPIAAPVQTEAVTPEVVQDAPKPAPDPEICPCGKSRGKRFDELPTDTLITIMECAAKYPAITADHKNAIVAILGERESAENDAAHDGDASAN